MFVTNDNTLLESQKGTNDFVLNIESSNQGQLQGIIQFDYLHQHFECSVTISASDIKIKSLFPFRGLVTAAPSIPSYDIKQSGYVTFDDAISKKGNQQLVWLILDIIHLYNLSRLKLSSIKEVYDEVFLIAQKNDPNISYGKINPHQTMNEKYTELLKKKLKIKHKHDYTTAIGLLASVQNLILQ
jgi:hypothetical protein